MGIANPTPSPNKSTVFSHTKTTTTTTTLQEKSHPLEVFHQNNNKLSSKILVNSMSEEYHQHHQPQQHQEANIFAFPNGFDRSTALAQQEDHSTTGDGLHPAVYHESGGMLSEMFNFGHGPPGPTSAPPEMLDYRRAVGGLGSPDWYGNSPRQQQQRPGIDEQHHHQQQQQHDHNQMGAINASTTHHHNSAAAAMQLFVTNPQPRSPSPPAPPQHDDIESGSGFHPLTGVVHHEQHHHSTSTANHPHFWGAPTHINNPGELSGMVEGQGLSLSLSSSLQHLEAAKQAEDQLRSIGATGDNTHIMFFNQGIVGPGPSPGPPSSAATSSAATHFFKNLTQQGAQPHQQHPIMLHNLQSVGGFGGQNSSTTGSASNVPHQVHLGFGTASTSSSSLGMVNALRNSKYAKPAQELLEEFCSVGRGHQLKKSTSKLGRQNSSTNQNPTSSGCGGDGSSSSTKDPPQLSPSDRIEHQRRKVKLLAMLDEVDRRYNHYCEQMQMVVNSFDLVMGYGAAILYTALAQKAMSRHFRCLKDAIHAQLKHSCELLGEKDPTGSSGLTKGETPRLRLLEQTLRQQRAFHQMGMMDQEAWRPQRGLPERSVNILRAWLFEHFLHPYPSDADKHLLARQTGLSRNQVSNWFINARVRLWKPMVEEMYQQEAKDLEDEKDRETNQTSSSTSNTNNTTNSNNNINSSFATTSQQQQIQQQQQPAVTQNPMPCSSATASSSTTLLPEGKRSADHTMHPTPPECDPSLRAINRHHHNPSQFHQASHAVASGLPQAVSHHPSFLQGVDGTCHAFGDDHPDDSVGPTTMIRFGTTTGDVSLTLGLRHAGNAPEKSAAFSVRDFRSC